MLKWTISASAGVQVSRAAADLLDRISWRHRRSPCPAETWFIAPVLWQTPSTFLRREQVEHAPAAFLHAIHTRAAALMVAAGDGDEEAGLQVQWSVAPRSVVPGTEARATNHIHSAVVVRCLAISFVTSQVRPVCKHSTRPLCVVYNLSRDEEVVLPLHGLLRITFCFLLYKSSNCNVILKFGLLFVSKHFSITI